MLKIKLVVVGGGNEGEEFQPKLPATLGRSRTATIPLPHPLVSREHCKLIERDQKLYVRDLGSTNGTFVGSEKVDADTVLEHASLLTIGTVTFRAYYDGLPRLATPADVDSADGRPLPVGVDDTSAITRIDTAHVNPVKTASERDKVPEMS